MTRSYRFRTILLATLIGTLLAAPALAQRAPRAQRAQRALQAIQAPRLDANLFPPELVMRSQKELDLSDEQAAAIREAVSETQARMTEVQWELTPLLQELRDVLSAERIEEDEVRTRLKRITTLENRAKELQVLLMVRVKNVLTPEQQDQLRRIRRERALKR